MTRGPWDQTRHGVRFDWGPYAASRLHRPPGALVVVDVLSFCTAVSVAVDRVRDLGVRAGHRRRGLPAQRNRGRHVAGQAGPRRSRGAGHRDRCRGALGASGLELSASGFAADVDIAADVDASESVPLLVDGAYVPAAR